MKRWQKLTQILGVSELWQVPGERHVVRSGHCWSQTLAMCLSHSFCPLTAEDPTSDKLPPSFYNGYVGGSQNELNKG